MITASSCRACAAEREELESLARLLAPRLRVFTVDAEHDPLEVELRRLNPEHAPFIVLPSLLLLEHGRVEAREVGFHPLAELLELVKTTFPAVLQTVHWEFAGSAQIPEEELASALVGQSLAMQVRWGWVSVRQKYFQHGFRDVEVSEAKLRPSGQTGITLRFEITEGEQYFIDGLKLVEGDREKPLSVGYRPPPVASAPSTTSGSARSRAKPSRATKTPGTSRPRAGSSTIATRAGTAGS